MQKTSNVNYLHDCDVLGKVHKCVREHPEVEKSSDTGYKSVL